MADEPHTSVAPTTTLQQDLTVAGQRRINLIWEYTQAAVAVMVVAFAMLVNTLVVLMLIAYNRDITVGQTIGISFINLICGMVISFYFSRTNHVAIGGIGPKATDDQRYAGR